MLDISVNRFVLGSQFTELLTSFCVTVIWYKSDTKTHSSVGKPVLLNP